VVLYDNAYLLNIDYTPNLFDTPSRNDYVNLYNLYSSSEKSIFFKDFNAKSYGYVDASGNLNVSSGCYLWVGDGNGSYVLINESSVDFTPSMDASSGMAVRWVLKNGITPIVESGGAQKVYNPSEFYSTMNYYRPGSSLSKPNPLSEVAILDDIKNVKLSTFHWRGHIYNGPAGSVKGIIYQPDEFWQVAALADDAPPTLNWSPINSIYQYDGAT
jgi:hypothetical protein